MTEAVLSPESSVPWASPTRAELFDLYKHAVDEYRFCVNLEWDRTKFFVTLNVSVVGVAATTYKVGALQTSGRVVGVELLVGFVTALLGLITVSRSHAYYREARDAFQRLERALGLSAFGAALATTEQMKGGTPGGASRWLPRVQNAVHALLAALALADLGFAILFLWPS